MKKGSAATVFAFKQGRIYALSVQRVNSSKWNRQVMFGSAESREKGETARQTLLRGLKEELGIKPVGLKKIGEKNLYLKQGLLTDNEKVQIFKSGFEGKIKLQKEEIIKGKWVPKKQLSKELEENPEKFTK